MTVRASQSYNKAFLIAGALIIVAAVVVRRVAKFTPAPVPVAVRAAKDPRIVALDNQLTQLQAGVARAPRDVKARWALADFFQKIGRIDKASEQLAEITRIQPDNVLAWDALGNTLFAQKRYAEGEQLYRNATRRWPKAAPPWQGLATSLYHEHRYLEASEAAREAVQLNRGDPNFRYMLGAALLEYVEQLPAATEYQNELKVARNNFMLILGAWPDKGDIYYRLGRCNLLLHEGRDAIKNLRRAMELMPDKPDIPVRLARVYIGVGQREAAQRVVEEAVQKFPRDAALHSMFGGMLETSPAPGDADKAMEQLRTAAALSPNSPVFLERYGAACLRVNKLPEARAALEKAQQLDRNRTYPYQQLAVLYARLGDHASSDVAARAAREMQTNEQTLERVQAQSVAHPRDVSLHMVLANRYRELGRSVAAAEEYHTALQLDPANAEAKRGVEILAGAAQNPGAAPK